MSLVIERPLPAAPLGSLLHPLVETTSHDEWAALQSTRLRETLRSAWTIVAWQRARLDAAGLHPDALHGIEDLRRLPFVHKADLREPDPFALHARALHALTRLHACRARPAGRRLSAARAPTLRAGPT
jgi:phenylacetate-coenzyme A ligase PaaK-like adenylate-forming protein